MSIDKVLDKEDIEFYLKELAKNIRKINGKYPPTEIIIVGGASILLNYNFRQATQDIDAFNSTSESGIKRAINAVTDKYNLENDWINSDFIYTNSYTPRLREFSKFYKQYSNCVSVYTVKDEYLIAMKIVSARLYKNDLSDIVGILLDSKNHITYESIDKAMNDLYDGWSRTNVEIVEMVKNLLSMNRNELNEIYSHFIEEQNKNKDILTRNSINGSINSKEQDEVDYELTKWYTVKFNYY